MNIEHQTPITIYNYVHMQRCSTRISVICRQVTGESLNWITARIWMKVNYHEIKMWNEIHLIIIIFFFAAFNCDLQPKLWPRWNIFGASWCIFKLYYKHYKHITWRPSTQIPDGFGSKQVADSTSFSQFLWIFCQQKNEKSD